jgi:hypothetical protein
MCMFSVLSAVGNGQLTNILHLIRLRRLVAGLSLQSPGFDPCSLRVILMVDKMALRTAFLRVLRLYPIIIIPPMLHIHLHLDVALSGRKNDRSLEIFQKLGSFGNRGSLVRKVLSYRTFRYKIIAMVAFVNRAVLFDVCGSRHVLFRYIPTLRMYFASFLAACCL